MSPALVLASRFLDAYVPTDFLQRQLRARTLELLQQQPDALHSRALPAHVTASALVWDPEADQILLMHHSKLATWTQMGGHCDGDGDLLGVALREAREETGLASLRPGRPGVLDLEIYRLPPRTDQPEHQHYDVRFLLLADSGAPLRPSGESLDMQWFYGKGPLPSCETALHRLVAKARSGYKPPEPLFNG